MVSAALESSLTELNSNQIQETAEFQSKVSSHEPGRQDARLEQDLVVHVDGAVPLLPLSLNQPERHYRQDLIHEISFLLSRHLVLRSGLVRHAGGLEEELAVTLRGRVEDEEVGAQVVLPDKLLVA